MWWIVGIVLLCIVIDWVSRTPPLVWLIFLTAIAAAIFGLYRLILTSSWLEAHDDERRRKREQQEREQENNALRLAHEADWAAYEVPTIRTFDEELKRRQTGLSTIFNAPNFSAFVDSFPYWQTKTMRVAEVKHAYALKLREAAKLLVVIPEATRFAGTWIVAPSGRGKTNLLHNMIAYDRGKGTVILMESKGDFNCYKGLPDVVVIDPYTAHINPLQLGSSTRSIEFLEYIFSALLDTSMTPLQKTLFRSVLTLLLQVPGATLETFREVLTHGWKPYEPYVTECDPSTRDFFLAKEFDSATYRETKQQVLWRLRLILSNEYLRAIFTAPTTNIQFSELLDSGKLILIDTEIDDLGEEGAEFFGRFFVALIWMAAVSRSKMPQEDKVPVYVYIDECNTVIKRDEKIATILDTCRSQKIALILAHQRVTQIVSANVLDALHNCAIRLANSDDDAEALAKRFRVDASQLRLPQGSFACFVRDQTAQARTISVPLFDTSQFPPPPEPLPVEPPLEPEPVAAQEPDPEPAVASPSPQPEKQTRKKGR